MQPRTRLTSATIETGGIALPVTSTKLGQNTIDLLCFALEIELGTKTSARKQN